MQYNNFQFNQKLSSSNYELGIILKKKLYFVLGYSQLLTWLKCDTSVFYFHTTWPQQGTPSFRDHLKGDCFEGL